MTIEQMNSGSVQNWLDKEILSPQGILGRLRHVICCECWLRIDLPNCVEDRFGLRKMAVRSVLGSWYSAMFDVDFSCCLVIVLINHERHEHTAMTRVQDFSLHQRLEDDGGAEGSGGSIDLYARQ